MHFFLVHILQRTFLCSQFAQEMFTVLCMLMGLVSPGGGDVVCVGDVRAHAKH